MVNGAEASTGSYCLIYSSNTANFGAGRELLIPELRFSSTTRNTFYVFEPPIISPDGFSANITTSAGFASVFYRYLATTTPEDVWVPYDMRNQKALSAQFYGVKAASVVVAGAAAAAGVGALAADFVTVEKVYMSTGPTLLYGMIASTGVANAATAFVVFRSTNVTGTGNTHMLLPPILYHTFNGNDESEMDWKTKIIRFPWPLYFSGGLTVQTPTALHRIRPMVRPARKLRQD